VFGGEASECTSESCIVLVRVDGWSVGVVLSLRGGWAKMSIWLVGVEYD
jgi:hypothetical protein